MMIHLKGIGFLSPYKVKWVNKVSGQDEQPSERVKEYFIVALRELEVAIEPVEIERIWILIKDKYADRSYHNLEHIEYCIDQSYVVLENPQYSGGTSRHSSFGQALMNLALIYHDIEQGENAEQRSYELFLEHLGDYFDEDNQGPIHMIRDHILITDHLAFDPERDHPVLTTNRRERYAEGSVYVKDADLSILGNQKHYNKYMIDVAIEYLGPDANIEEWDEYYRGRIDFLNQFLNQPMIYKTRAFGLLYEWYARENIFREITMHKMILNRRNEERGE